MTRCSNYVVESNQGKSFNYSEWNSDKTYVNNNYKQDFVSYNGAMYACISDVTGINPEVETRDGLISGQHWIQVMKGAEGPKGEQGQSIVGPQGDPGESAYELAVKHGYTGSEEQWLTSLIGQMGPRGPKGEDGLTVVGPQGKQGYSAYEVAVRNGFTGSEIEWLATLVGPQGQQGRPGVSIQGPRGFDGKDGADGKSIILVDGEDGIYWHYEGEEDNKHLIIDWDRIIGPEGPAAKQIIIGRNEATGNLVWRYEGEPITQNRLLVEYSEIKGDSITGAWVNDDGWLYIRTSASSVPFLAGYVRGEKGEDGDRIVLRVSNHNTLDPDEPIENAYDLYLQYKYDGQDWRAWTDIIQINELMDITLAGIQFEVRGVVWAHQDENGYWIEGEGSQYLKVVCVNREVHPGNEGEPPVLGDIVSDRSVLYFPLRRIIQNVSIDTATNKITFTIDDPEQGIITEEIDINFRSGDGITVDNETSTISINIDEENNAKYKNQPILHVDEDGLKIDDAFLGETITGFDQVINDNVHKYELSTENGRKLFASIPDSITGVEIKDSTESYEVQLTTLEGATYNFVVQKNIWINW